MEQKINQECQDVRNGMKSEDSQGRDRHVKESKDIMGRERPKNKHGKCRFVYFIILIVVIVPLLILLISIFAAWFGSDEKLEFEGMYICM